MMSTGLLLFPGLGRPLHAHVAMNERDPTEAAKAKDDIAIVLAFGAAVVAGMAGWLYVLWRLLAAVVARLL